MNHQSNLRLMQSTPEDSITETIYADSVFPLVESVSITMKNGQEEIRFLL